MPLVAFAVCVVLLYRWFVRLPPGSPVQADVPTADAEPTGASISSAPASAAAAEAADELEQFIAAREAKAQSGLGALRSRVEALALTPAQQAFLSDHTLLRYLCVTEGDAAKALVKIQDTLAWRTQHIDNRPCACRACEADPDSHCFFALGPDARGWELMYACPARSRRKDPDGGLAHMYMVFESAFARNSAPGKIAWLIDLKNLGLRDIDPRTATTAVPVFANHYPERLGQVCLLDAPAVFKFIYSRITPLVDPLTARKVRMLRGEEQAQYLARYLTPAQAGFMREALQMKATPGSLPACTAALRRPLLDEGAFS